MIGTLKTCAEEHIHQLVSDPMLNFGDATATTWGSTWSAPSFDWITPPSHASPPPPPPPPPPTTAADVASRDEWAVDWSGAALFTNSPGTA